MHRVFHPILISSLFLILGCTQRALVSNEGHLIYPLEGPVTSWYDLQQLNLYSQEYDYSCGAASFATLLHYHFGDKVSEQDVIAQIERVFSPDQRRYIEQHGLSLFELETLATDRGYRSASMHLSFEALASIQVPMIIFVEPQGYPHFAVFRGVVGDRVFIADPSRGNLQLSVTQFLNEWHGKAFIMETTHPRLPSQHLKVQLKAPIHAASSDQKWLAPILTRHREH